MKMTKMEGLRLLECLKLPTVSKLDIGQILNGQISLEQGLSLRVSPKGTNFDRNVYLPSIHNCSDINEIRAFIDANKGYNIFAHYTVKPEVIGSISRLKHTQSVIIETYKNFEDRKKEIIDNRVVIPILDDKLWISKMDLLKKDVNDFKNFKKIILHLNDIPFKQYDIEYVIQNDEVIFTDLTLPDYKEYQSYRSFFIERQNENGNER